MKTKLINKDTLVNSIGLISVTSLLLGTLNPMDWSSLRPISNAAINIMFIFLATGFISFLLRKNFMLLLNFSACIALCTYLKQAHNGDFTHSQANTDPQISIANFVLEDADDILKFNKEVAALQADLISVQVPIHKMDTDWLSTKNQTDFPYCTKTICGDSLAIIILSNSIINNLDTLCFDNAISIAGNIKVEGINQEIAFISTHVPNKGVHTSKQLALLSSYIRENHHNSPLLTLSGSNIKSWMPEIQSFKATNTLSDSRMDIDFYNPNKHIFFSKDLVCTNFKNVKSGNGVLATYQLKKHLEV